jgi:photosynthetic reaction center H subunit
LDVAQVVLYVFWLFFFLLILYLRREDRREGYPLISEDPNEKDVWAVQALPEPKQFLLSDGSIVEAPRDNGDKRVPNATPMGPAPGTPMQPNGDPMLSQMGPASFAEREHRVDITVEGHPRIVPLRADDAFYLETRDPDPRGMPVIGADGLSAGTVVDVWVDRSEMLLRYLEVELAVTDDHRRVLLPINMAKVHRRHRRVDVSAIFAAHFANVPTTEQAEQVTLLEEDKIMAYYGGGTLFAAPSRIEPLI